MPSSAHAFVGSNGTGSRNDFCSTADRGDGEQGRQPGTTLMAYRLSALQNAMSATLQKDARSLAVSRTTVSRTTVDCACF
jgi:hypothetical protein